MGSNLKNKLSPVRVKCLISVCYLINGQYFTIRFSQKNSDLNKVDIPEVCVLTYMYFDHYSTCVHVCGNSQKIVLTKMGVTINDGRVVFCLQKMLGEA